MNNLYICYAIIVILFTWMIYIQIKGWRKTRGFGPALENDLMDRFHEEVIYQMCYKRGYHITLEMDEDAYWKIKKTDHPNKRRVKLIVFWSFIIVMLFPFNYRTNKNPNFDDFDPKHEVPDDRTAKDI